MEQTKKTMEKIVALCKNRGIVYPGSEIYGGLANSWDFGPLGVEFKNNIKKAWWKKFVQESKYNVGLDSAIIMNKETWVASGHLKGFADPLMDCKACETAVDFRARIYDAAVFAKRNDLFHCLFRLFHFDKPFRLFNVYFFSYPYIPAE